MISDDKEQTQYEQNRELQQQLSAAQTELNSRNKAIMDIQKRVEQVMREKQRLVSIFEINVQNLKDDQSSIEKLKKEFVYKEVFLRKEIEKVTTERDIL